MCCWQSPSSAPNSTKLSWIFGLRMTARKSNICIAISLLKMNKITQVYSKCRIIPIIDISEAQTNISSLICMIRSEIITGRINISKVISVSQNALTIWFGFVELQKAALGRKHLCATLGEGGQFELQNSRSSQLHKVLNKLNSWTNFSPSHSSTY